MQKKRFEQTSIVDSTINAPAPPARHASSGDTPGRQAVMIAGSTGFLFVVAVGVIALIGHFAWVMANGWILLLAAGGLALVIWQWPRIHTALLDHKQRKADIKQAEMLAGAEAARIKAEAARIEAEARQLHYMLPPDNYGNVFYHPDQGGPALLNSPNYNPNYGVNSIHMHNTAAPGQTSVTEEKPGRQLMLPAPQGIPPLYDLVEAFRQVDVGPDCILLGRSDQSAHVTVGDNKLCHGVFNAITGRGKTIVERGIASQLVHAEHLVTWLDLKFALVTEEGLDYRPLASKLWAQAPMRITIDGRVYEVPHVVRNEGDIAAVLHWLAYDELERRLWMRDAGDFSFPTHFIFLEEMLAFIKQYPAAADDVVRIIALGRELRVKLFTAAQKKTLKRPTSWAVTPSAAPKC